MTGQKTEETDGVSFLPTLLGQTEKQKQHEYLYWEFASGGGQYAVRAGNWKGVRVNIKLNSGAKWEIYNLADDRSETTDVSAQHPDLVKKFEEIVKQRVPSVFDKWNF